VLPLLFKDLVCRLSRSRRCCVGRMNVAQGVC